MIGRSEEYEKMFQLEGQLWWYRHLHERTEAALQQQFGQRRDMQILDAGCGTGGMLDFLRRKGYENLRGIDGSTDAITFCQERGFSVTSVNLNDLAAFEPTTQYDAIICNDVFCYFTEAELPPLVAALAQRLKPAGILISNNNAFRIFAGQHDIAVGILRRFVLADFGDCCQRGFTDKGRYLLEFCVIPPNFADAAMAAAAIETRLATAGNRPVGRLFAQSVGQ